LKDIVGNIMRQIGMGTNRNSPILFASDAGEAPKASLQVGLVSIAYFLANLLALLFPDTDLILASIWPAAGISLAALLLSRRGRWPSLMAGVFVAGVAADLLAGRPLGNSVGFMTANVAESLTCAFVIQRLCGADIRFERTNEVAALVFAATACNACTALIGAGTATLAVPAAFRQFWLTWWISDGLGILLVTPLIVTWARALSRPRGFGWKKAVEAAAFTAIWCMATWLIFQKKSVQVLAVPQPFYLFALIVYAALRFRMHGTSSLILLLSILLLTSSQVIEGGLIWGGDNEAQRVLLAQIFIATVTVTGLFLCAVLSERMRAEKDLSEEKAKLETIFNVAPLAMTMLDETGKLRLWNPAAEKMFGWPKEEVMGRPISIIPDSKDLEYAELSAQVLGGQVIEMFETLRQRRDGSLIDVSLSSASIYNPARERIGRMAIMADITRRKQAEAELEASLAEKEILLRELHHRTRNNMNVIISMLNMQATQCGDESLTRAFSDAENRIYSMALVHQKLYESGDLARVSLKRYLSDLCEHLISAYGIEPDLIAFKKDIEDISVRIETAIPFGLIANELVSNALKHAFPKGRRGTITVALGLDGDGAIALKISDDGIGVEDVADLEMRMGLGTVVGLGEEQLSGRIAFSSGPGFACELRFADQPRASAG